MKKSFFLFALLFAVTTLIAQKEITVENIWQDYLFYPKSVPGFNFLNDGKHYTRLEKNTIKKYDLTTGTFVEDILSASAAGFEGEVADYTFSKSEDLVLLQTELEKIYRRSFKANYLVWNGKQLEPLSKDGKQSYATFSPDGSKVAFVRENNLYCKDLATNKETKITNDGKKNHIINGGADWVYEEEFSFAKAFQWSPDSKKIAFLRFDETAVPEFTMTNYHDDAYPEYETFKYPKVGEKNATVTVFMHNLDQGKTTKVDTEKDMWKLDDPGDVYFPRIKWTKDPEKLCVFRMNRHQNHLQLLLADAKSGKTSMLLEEKSKYYIDITDDLTFLEDGKHFIWTSEKSGYNHIYLYDMKGKEVKQLTSGKYDVSSFQGFDEKRGIVFYQAAEESPLERQVYIVDIKGKKKKKITPKKGTNNVQFSSTYDYYVLNHSDLNNPSTYSVYNFEGKEIRKIEENLAIQVLKKEYNIQESEFFNFKTSQNVNLNGWMIKPPNFDPSKKYPVFMYVYGGPGSQTVKDQYGGFNYWWFQMLAQKGYVVVSVDNRGTGARGEEFKKMTYLELGKFETMDQIEAAQYMGSLPYVDAERIGIFGWSYGGYMSSLCLFKGADIFKTAIAVAPVTNWKWYDTIYTERYMRTNKENESGYKDNSPVYFADLLKGNYLLVHGMADDNVHFQNTAEMVSALVKANKQFDTYFYPNKNHGIYGGTTRLHLYNKMTDFIINKL